MEKRVLVRASLAVSLLAAPSAFAVPTFDSTSKVATAVSGDATRWFCALDVVAGKVACAYAASATASLNWCNTHPALTSVGTIATATGFYMNGDLTNNTTNKAYMFLVATDSNNHSEVYDYSIYHNPGDGQDCYTSLINSTALGPTATPAPLSKRLAVAADSGGTTWVFAMGNGGQSSGHLFMIKMGSWGGSANWTTADLSDGGHLNTTFDNGGVMAGTESNSNTPMVTLKDSDTHKTAVVFQDNGLNQPNNSWQKITAALGGTGNPTVGSNLAIASHPLVTGTGGVKYGDSIFTVGSDGHLYQAEVYWDNTPTYSMIAGTDVGSTPGSGYDDSTDSLAASTWTDTTVIPNKVWSTAYPRANTTAPFLYRVWSDVVFGGTTTVTSLNSTDWGSGDTFKGLHSLILTTDTGTDHVGGVCHHSNADTVCRMSSDQGSTVYHWTFLP